MNSTSRIVLAGGNGFLMYPMSLKRNHISLAHTADDIDRTLETAEIVLREMAREGLFADPVSAIR